MTQLQQLILAIFAFLLAIVMLYSGVRALKQDEVMSFAGGIALAIMFLTYTITYFVKVWWYM